ncbi:MAG TPA: T9SS type A sorting domain-containing protein, partial [Flavobacteriales bacterium]|nr:T9SS type A sorting domain-containing protein [Flavobacteriales bacterium]
SYVSLCPWPNNNTTTIQDANGCAQTYDEPDAQIQYVGHPFVQAIEPACEGGANGSATVVFGGLTPQTCTVNGVGGVVFWSGVPTEGVPVVIEDLPAGNYDAVCTAEQSPNCVEGTSFTVPEIVGACNSVSGEVYHDESSDCVQDVGDVALANQVLTAEPGPYYTLTNAQGNYSLNLPAGNYTLAQNNPGVQQVCPPQVPVPFTIGGVPVTIDLADHGTQPLNVEVQCTALEARPGHSHQVWITVRNTTYFTSGNLTVDVDFDPLVTFTNSSLGGYTLTPGHLQWITTALPAFGSYTIHLAFDVPPDPGLIGTTLLTSTTVQDALTEVYLTDNNCGTSTTIQGPYDPNTKHAATSSGQSDAFYFLQQDTSTVWTIRFQNVGSATAHDVVIADTLSPLLDIGTLRFLDFSHPCAPSLEEGRLLKFTFAGIELPDSTSDEAASHGFVRFAIEPHAGLLPGMVMANTAHIFFDQNPAIITNEPTLLVTISTGLSQATSETLTIRPNPAHDRLMVSLPPGQQAVQVTVLGTDGRAVWNGPLLNDGIDVSALNAGAYVLDVRMRNGEHIRARFVKQ